ncbi:hypothetical protein [Flammeovirga pacifica]|uniref:Uncharacterized protein n=1 Tax=Flammeovirga pacifica TaxID=915059 RepID=A0A1S1YSY4_FLAPC|nr:hypothetical protein [Flammeovirga pacifica]OHX64137.1 hypothetical protein NH26_21265 [Flammeovirga pacifica]
MNKLSLTLIDNVYNVDESKELLISIVDHKIQFLNKKIFERFLKQNLGSQILQKRVGELKEERKKLTEIINEYQDSDAIFDIDCSISIVKKEFNKV